MDDIVARIRGYARTHWSEETLYSKLAGCSSARVEVCDEEIEHITQAHGDIAAILDDALSRMRKLRNESASIHRLPTEILCAIFRAAGECGLDLPTNLAISSLCSHWRAVALGDPWMWTRYDLASPVGEDSLETLLQRSRQCPLELYAYSGVGIESLLSANIDRLSVLQSIFEDESSDGVEPYLIAPRLEHLAITFLRLGRNPVHHQLPLIIEAPQLKSLELANCRLSWRSGLYSNLTTLKITLNQIFAYREGVIRYLHDETDSDILEIPYASPGLEHLEIHLPDPAQYHLDPSDLPPMPAYAPIHLHALRTLVLVMRTESALRILNGIVLHEDMRRIDLCFWCHDADVLHTLLRYRYLPRFFFTDLRTLLISSNARTGETNISWSTFLTGSGRTARGNEYRLNLKVEFSGSIVFGIESSSAFHRLLPAHAKMSSLQELELSGNTDSQVVESARAIAEFVVSLPCLSTLGLYAGFNSSFEALRDALTEAAFLFRRALPRLKCIRIGTYPMSHIFEDVTVFAQAIPFLRLFTRHLQELHVGAESFQYRGDQDVLRDLIDGFRRLGVPTVWWNMPFHVMEEGFADMVIHARELWPQDEPYNWRCKNEEGHDEDGSNWFICNTCGAPGRG